jgi:hypothetical protein
MTLTATAVSVKPAEGRLDLDADHRFVCSVPVGLPVVDRRLTPLKTSSTSPAAAPTVA